MKNEDKEFNFSPKKKGDRVYSGAYGDGTVIGVDDRRGRTRSIYLDKKRVSLPDPILVINFDHHQEHIEQYDSDVGSL